MFAHLYQARILEECEERKILGVYNNNIHGSSHFLIDYHSYRRTRKTPNPTLHAISDTSIVFYERFHELKMNAERNSWNKAVIITASHRVRDHHTTPNRP